ncbi:MAG: tetratricopeptide repeat protein [Gemmataceae bacterium]
MRVVLLLALVGITCVSGCVNSIPFVSGFAGETKEEPELPPHEAAKLRLKTADVMLKQNKLAEALELYLGARHAQDSLKIAHKIALLYDRLGHTESAEREYRRAIEERPNDSSVANSYGRFYYDRRQWAKAEKQFRRALELANNENQSLWQKVGLAKKKPKSKIRHLKALAWNNLGLALAQQRKYKESFKAFAQAVPPAAAHSNLAFILTAQGDHAAAMREYRKALHINPELEVAKLALKKLQNRVVSDNASITPVHNNDGLPRSESLSKAGQRTPNTLPEVDGSNGRSPASQTEHHSARIRGSSPRVLVPSRLPSGRRVEMPRLPPRTNAEELQRHPTHLPSRNN